MRTRERWVHIVLCAALGGCSLLHGVSEDPADAGAAVIDAASHPDGAVSPPDGEPLPADPEPDPGPDGRPSDHPDAADWEEPEPPAECCDLEDPVRIVPPAPTTPYMPFEADGPAHVVWNHAAWGVFLPRAAGTDGHVGLAQLTADGEPEGSPSALLHSYIGALNASWAAGRYGLVANEGVHAPPGLEPTLGLRFGTYDVRGVPDGPLVEIPREEDGRVIHGMHAVRLPHGARWLVVHGEPTGVVISSVREHTLEGTEQLLGGSPHTVGAVGMSSRVAVVTRLESDAGAASSHLVSVAWPPSETTTLDVALPDAHPVGWVAYRDWVVVLMRELSGEGRRFAVVVDPFEGVVRSQTEPWAVPGDGFNVRMAADDKRGRIGACLVDVNGGREIYFQLHGPDGARTSDPVLVGRPTRLGSFGCTIAFDGDRYLVAWNDLDEGVFVRGVRTREE